MSKTLRAQENVRLTPDLKYRFEAAVKGGCYSKSEVLRQLVERWVTEVEGQSK